MMGLSHCSDIKIRKDSVIQSIAINIVFFVGVILPNYNNWLIPLDSDDLLLWE